MSSDQTEVTPLIELRNIDRTFVTGGGVEVRALKNVSLKIHKGEFVAIIGQSGSGKSTMMNILGCLDRPTAGDYLFAGRDIKSFDADGLAWLRVVKRSVSFSKVIICSVLHVLMKMSKCRPFMLACPSMIEQSAQNSCWIR